MNFVFPLFTMFLLVFSVGLLAFVARVQSVRKRQLHIRDFELLVLNKTPPFVERSTRHLANLFEMPVLFYVVCLIALSLRIDDSWATGLAWGYVALRCVHSFIHLTYNRVNHRMPAFMTSNVVLAALWVRIFVLIAS